MINKTKFSKIWLALSLLANIAHAQPDSNARQPLVECYVMGGGQFVNFSGLNGQLQKAGLDKVISAMAGFGFGFGVNLHRFTAGIDASVMQGYQHDVSATSAAGHIYLAVNALRSKSWTLAPEAGISWQAITVNITELGTAGSFNDALTHTQNQVELQHNNTMLDLALAFKMRPFYPFLGRLGVKPICKFGYRYGLGNNSWEVRRSSVSDGPKDRASNFYLSLVLGFGHT